MTNDASDQLEYLRRGLAEELPHESLAAKLKLGRPLRVKLGVDPTASRVHLGWAVVLRKLRQFQEMGHTAVLIMGDYTAQIGDPSDKSATRKRLTAEQVQEYTNACIDRVKSVLLPERLEVRFNSEWLGPLDMEGILLLTSQVTVAQMLEREDFSKRYREGRPISLIEFLYPLLQAYDSVAVQADIELGGTDQTFNNLMGRHLQEALEQQPQIVCTLPLLVGTDGTDKMSQSLGNFIAIDEEPGEMFGKLMSVPDPLIVDYARLAAWFPTAEVVAIEQGLANGTLHPNVTKRRVSREVVAIYHGADAAATAEESFDRQFKHKELPLDIPAAPLPITDAITLFELVATIFGESKNESRRLIQQGGVRIDQTVHADPNEQLTTANLDGKVLQVGKRRFARLTLPK